MFARSFRFIGCIFIALWAAACAPQALPAPTAAPLQPTSTVQTLTPSVSVLPSRTSLPASTATPPPAGKTATATLAPSLSPATPYPTANRSAPLSSRGPWLAFPNWSNKDQGEVLVINADGSSGQSLPIKARWILGNRASPHFVASTWQTTTIQNNDKVEPDALAIVHLPEMKVVTIPLIVYSKVEAFDFSQVYPNLSRENVLKLLHGTVGTLAWSPNGRYLAFTAAIDGPTSDLYLYDTLDDQIRRLTDGLDMALSPEWSPDGKWIVHRGMDTFGEGCYETGVWAAAVDGSEVKWLDRGECFEITEWTGPETFDTYTPEQGGARMGNYVGPEKRFDIATGTATLLSPAKTYSVDDRDQMRTYDCLTRERVTKFYYETNSRRIDSPDGKWFVVIHDGLQIYSADGKLVEEFKTMDAFYDWQPDSSAIVFTSLDHDLARRTIHYYRPADRTQKTFSVRYSGQNIYFNLSWGLQGSDFFLWYDAGQDLFYVQPDLNRLDQIDAVGNFGNFTWVGKPEEKRKSRAMACYLN